MFYKKSSTFFRVMLILLLSLIVTGSALCAPAEEITAVAEIAVKQTFSVNSERWKPEARFAYVLTAADPASPMPEGAANGEYRFTLDGNEERRLSVVYPLAGVYVYQLRPDTPEPQTGYTYDDEVFTLTVVVKNTDDGGLTATVELPVNHSGFKETNIQFDHTYFKALPKPPKTEDAARPGLWTATLIGSGVLILLCLLAAKRQNEKGGAAE